MSEIGNDPEATVYRRRYEPTDPRLGRHVRHDVRSHRYAVGVLPKSAIKAVHWTRRIPILDQGQLGACTMNAFTGLRGTDNSAGQGVTSVTITDAAASASQGFFTAGDHTLDETFAVAGYSLETRLDSFPGQYPPDDTGSDALGAMAAGKALGLVTVFQHAFSVSALQSGLQSGAAMWGTEWLNSMFDVDKNGFLIVDKRSGVAGGHELIISGYDPATDVYTIDNSWGTSWGQNGSAQVKGSDMQWLLSQDGDVTFPTWTTAPAPAPVPPTPTPVPADVDAALWTAAQTWATAKGFTV